MLTGCGVSDSRPRDANPAASQLPVPQGMERHRDARGFTVAKPAGWQVAGNDAGEIWVSEPGTGVFALMRARDADGDLSRWMRGALLQRERWVRHVHAAAVEAVTPQAARAGYVVTDAKGTQLRVQSIAVRHGSVATVFIAAAPSDRFEQALPTLAAILSSVRFEPGTVSAGASAPPQLRYETWRDPQQLAFTVDRPHGWSAFGGAKDFGFVTDFIFAFSSPDNLTMVFHGDPLRETFYLPTEMYDSFGWREGGRYTQDGQNYFTVLRPQPLDQLAQRSLQAMLQTQVRIERGRARPDIVRQRQQANQMVGARSGFTDAAEFEFSTGDGRRGFVALSISGFSEAQVGGAGTWAVDGFSGYIAPEARQAEGAAVLGRLLGSMRANMQWLVVKKKFNEIDAARMRDYQAQAAQQQDQYMQERAHSMAQVQGGRLNVLGGTVDLIDPETNERMQVKNTSQYYFRVTPTPTGGEVVVGSDVSRNDAPLDLRQMLQVGIDVPFP
jgi:hypothetical protein